MKLTEMRKTAGQIDDVARAASINPYGELFRNGEIVNRREMKHARRLLLDQREILFTQREARLADVAFDKCKFRGISTAELRKPRNLLACTSKQCRLHQQDEIAILPRESFEEPVRDEARKSSYE